MPGELRRRWTASEDAELTKQFGIIPIEDIAKRIGRSHYAICLRCVRLGLDRSLITQGHVTVPELSETHELHQTTVITILRWAGCHASPMRFWPTGAKGANLMFDACAGETAIERWKAAETLASASHRIGVSTTTLRRWLVADKVKTGRYYGKRSGVFRIDASEVDRLAADWFSRDRLTDTCAKLGCNRGTLAKWLTNHGYKRRGRVWRLTEAEVIEIAANFTKTDVTAQDLTGKRSKNGTVILERTGSRLHDGRSPAFWRARCSDCLETFERASTSFTQSLKDNREIRCLKCGGAHRAKTYSKKAA